MNKEIKFYQHLLLTWLLLLIYPPFGIILLWKVRHYDLFTRSIISLFFGLLFLELHNIYSSFIRALVLTIIITYTIYRYHKLADYKLKVNNLVNYALKHLEIQKIFTNYLTKYSPPTNNYYDCLLFEIYLRNKYPIIYKHLNLTHLEDTYINIIYSESKYLINFIKSHNNNLQDLLKKQEHINDNYLQELMQIKKIISPILKIKGDKFTTYLTFILLKKFSITFYSDKFNQLFAKEFTHLKDLDEIIYKYLTIASLDTNKNSQDLTMFTYYLINKNLLNNPDFYEGINITNKKLQILEKKRKENLFKKHLFTSENELLSEIASSEIIEEMKTKERFTSFTLELLKKLGYVNIISPLNKYLDYIITLNKHQFGINIVFLDNLIKLKKEHINSLIAGLKYNQINKGILITNSIYTDEIIKYGEKNNIIIWDKDILKQKALEIKRLNNKNNIKFNDISPIPYEKISITEIDTMTSFEFKYYIIELYKRKGYYIKKIITANDETIDLIMEKNSLTFGVIIKKENNIINVQTIKDMVAATNYYNFDNSIIITNNSFSKEAKYLAHICNITLYDREDLIEQIKKH